MSNSLTWNDEKYSKGNSRWKYEEHNELKDKVTVEMDMIIDLK